MVWFPTCGTAGEMKRKLKQRQRLRSAAGGANEEQAKRVKQLLPESRVLFSGGEKHGEGT